MGKDIEAILIPSDGPLLSPSQNDEPFKKQACDLLQSSDLTSLEYKTIQEIVPASTIKQQLNTLRAYRSTLLNIKGQLESISDGRKNGLCGLYRLLLELGFSNDTPHPLKRASQACLVAMQGILDSKLLDSIHKSVVCSLFNSELLWKNPNKTLFDTVAFDCTLNVILNKESNYVLEVFNLLLREIERGDILDIIESYGDGDDVGVVSVQVMSAIENGVEICDSLKLFLRNDERLLQLALDNGYEFKQELLESMATLRTFVEILLRCKATSPDALSVCSVTLSQLFLLHSRIEGFTDDELLAKIRSLVDTVIGGKEKDSSFELLVDLPSLNKLSIVKGLVGTLTDETLSAKSGENDEIFLLDPFGNHILNVADVTTENSVRLLGLKALETVLGRWKSILSSRDDAETNFEARKYADKVLQVALSTWESPPSRRIGSAIPNLFQSIVKLMDVLDQKDHGSKGKIKFIDNLVIKILSQPSTRKGKYVALDALLPKVGASKLLELANSSAGSSSSALVSSFFAEIGRRGNSAGAVAELLAKIISMLRIEMHKKAGIDLDALQDGNKKDRKKKSKVSSVESESGDGQTQQDAPVLLKEWNMIWALPLANALIHSTNVSRTQIVSFCFPLITTFVGGKGNKMLASQAFAFLLQTVQDEVASSFIDEEALLWTKLEIVRHANQSNLLKAGQSSKTLTKAISKALPLEEVETTLFHENNRLRLAAFRVLSSVIPSYCERSDKENLQIEADLWKKSLLYSSKCADREYIISLTQSLRSFLDRMLNAESNEDNDSSGSLLLNFVRNFLISEMFMKQVAYPGTVAEKEKWSLSMIDCIIGFGSCDLTTLSKQMKVRKYSQTKRMSENQHYLCEMIMNSIISTDVIATLLSMMHSMWDNTRSSVYDVLMDIFRYAFQKSVTLPDFFSNQDSCQLLFARAVHLASSPRQREADTGARMISVLCYTSHDRYNFMKKLSKLLEVRLTMMESALGAVNDNTDLSDSGDLSLELPLAHGLIQSSRLIIDREPFHEVSCCEELYQKLTTICFNAIKISLTIVADMKEETDENETSGEEWRNSISKKKANVPLNVNTGAIGANGTFSSLTSVDEDEKKIRLLKQRVVMGTWLLIKEACATLASVIEAAPVVDYDLLSTAGSLLLSTLTSLKHQGAAFAAHKSLQRLCILCYSGKSLDNKVRKLPTKWIESLLRDISSKEMVRDSTLRRSTGYGLGFLSVLRSENASPKFLFTHALSRVIQLSLPPCSRMATELQKWNKSGLEMFVFGKYMDHATKNNTFIPENSYHERTRIHALNILRLVILDAPLAGDINEFIGDSIISSLIGYKDGSWAVRNSATMCFAAAMLRVVDADKNADMSFSRATDTRVASAVTCKELFRSYPQLVVCLLSVLREENTKSDPLHPTLFPVLLLLARLQPLTMQRVDPGDDDLPQQFIIPIISNLGHVHHKVRLAAARALVVLCCDDDIGGKALNSRARILQVCVEKLSPFQKQERVASHNFDEGLLLAIKFLLRSSSAPMKYFNGNLLRAIKYFSTLGDYSLRTPPFCSKVALDIWYEVSYKNKSNENTNREMDQSLLRTAHRVLGYVEKRSKCAHTTIGISQLAQSAVQVISSISFEKMFSPSTESEERIQYSKCIQLCFESDSFDAMLYSVKAFKKGIYDKVEDMRCDRELSNNIKRQILTCVGRLSMQALNTIISRDGFGAHVPTCRRLCRISLETTHLVYALTDSFSISDYFDIPILDLWTLSMNLQEMSGFNLTGNNIEPEKLSGGNGLSGSTVELFAFIIREIIEVEQGLDVSTKMAVFTELIEQATHPLSNWKTRYSAAIAAKISGIFDIPLECKGDLSHSLNSSCRRISLRLLELLQDSDEDVRRATRNVLLSSEGGSFLPRVINLEEMSSQVVKRFASPELYLTLLRHFVSLCDELKATLKKTMKEYSFTIHSPKPEDVLNICTDRKIFEEEDPNPHAEVLVTIQMLASMLSEFPNDFALCSDASKEIAQIFAQFGSDFEQIFDTIFSMRKNTKCPDFAHNLSFDANSFAFTHSVVLGVALGIRRGDLDYSILSQTANSMAIDVDLLHPSLVNVLRGLDTSKDDSGCITSTLIKNTCFLLPSSNLNREFL